MKFIQMIPFKVKHVCFDEFLKHYLEIIIFEDWSEKPFSMANHESRSAINLAQLYWQGFGHKFVLNHVNRFNSLISNITIMIFNDPFIRK